MPRVKLGRDPAEERVENRRRLIQSKAAMRGYFTQRELAQALGLSESQLSYTLKGQTYVSWDLIRKLDNVLRLNAEELAKLVRGK